MSVNGIDNFSSGGINKSATSAAKPKAADVAAESTLDKLVNGGSDTVSLSSSANLSQAPVNVDKINQIKDAMREGKFSVNPEKIANRLIEETKELLSQA